MKPVFTQSKTVQFDSSSLAIMDGNRIGLSWPGLDVTQDHYRVADNVDASSQFVLVENTDPTKSIRLESYGFGHGWLDNNAPNYEPLMGTLSVSGSTEDIAITWPRYLNNDIDIKMHVVLPPGTSLVHNQVTFPTTLPGGETSYSLNITYAIVDVTPQSAFASSTVVVAEGGESSTTTTTVATTASGGGGRGMG